MDISFSKIARSMAALIAASVFASLALQVYVNLEPEGSIIGTFGLMLRFFTVWTNLAAGIVLAWLAWKGSADARILFALTTAIVIVASVYHAVLAAHHQPVDAGWWTNLMFHTIIPVAVTVWWLAFMGSSQISWKSLPVVMIWPVTYTVFALINGAATGFYAYFFLDLPALGWPQLLLNITGLAVFFMLVGAALLGLRKFAIRAVGN